MVLAVENEKKRAMRWFSPQPTSRVWKSSSGFALIEATPARVLQDEPLPPWKQTMRLVVSGRSSCAGFQCSDLWSSGMRCSVVRSFFPSRGKSKVAKEFHSKDRQNFDQKMKKKAEILIASTAKKLPNIKGVRHLSLHTATRSCPFP